MHALKLLFRIKRRHPVRYLVTVGGLAVGIATATLIALFVADEFSYDRYHRRPQDIYRVYMDRQSGDAVIRWARTPAPLAPALQDAFPDIEAVVRIRKNPRTDLVRLEDEVRFEDSFYFADSSLFDVFSIDLVRGSAGSSLADPGSVLISTSAARRYFGTSDPIGRTIHLNGDRDFIIRGVFHDMPANSYFRADFFASFESLPEILGENRFSSWTWVDHHTFIRLVPGSDPGALEKKLSDFLDQSSTQRFASTTRLRLQPLTRIHLHSDLKDELQPVSDVRFSGILSVAAILILFAAAANYLLITVAEYSGRSLEIGVRRTLGAGRWKLTRQFMIEVVSTSLQASALAAAITLVLLPRFSILTGKAISAGSNSMVMISALLAFPALIGLAAGFFPFLKVSRVPPARILREQKITGDGKLSLRSGLVVLQITSAAILLVSALTIERQLELLKTSAVGFDNDRIVVIPIRDRAARREDMPVLKEALLSQSGIRSVSAASSVPGIESHIALRYRGPGMSEPIQVPTVIADDAYVETYRLNLARGSDFRVASQPDSVRRMLLNKQAVARFGLEDPVGTSIQLGGDVIVTGVVNDYQFQSMHHEIEPLVIVQGDYFRFIGIKIAPGSTEQTLESIRRVWADFEPARPLEFWFLDDRMETQYRAEKQVGDLMGYFSGIALLMASLGLVGISNLAVGRRMKEIGVRKVVGATEMEITGLLTRQFGRLVAVGLLLAIPLAYVGVNRWLDAFAYRVNVSIATVAYISIIIFATAILSTAFQIFTAARVDPVQTLRAE